MNRRDLLQILGLAPVVALTSTPAQAAVDEGGAVSNICKTLDDWNERKLFSITATIDEYLPQECLLALVADRENNPPSPQPLFKIDQVIHAVTKTPDIMTKGTVAVLGKDGATWGEFPVETHKLFTEGPSMIARLIICAGRDEIVKSMPAHLQQLANVITRMENGAMTEQLKSLGAIDVKFFYYGPSPYPQDGRIYSYNYETNAFEPLRRG